MKKKSQSSTNTELEYPFSKGNNPQGGISFLELTRVRDKKTRAFVEQALQLANPEFFHIPASSSGKYHPAFAQGEGGLVRHTKAALILADELFPLYNFSDLEKNRIRAALILHDIEKPHKEHPILVKKTLKPLAGKWPKTYKSVIGLIESHMGQWNLDGVLPTPVTEAQRFVHLCDYLASRKVINITM